MRDTLHRSGPGPNALADGAAPRLSIDRLGAGRISRADRARFFAIARGSATECAAILDVLRVRRLASASDCAAARTLLARIVQMLTKWVAPRG